MGSRVKLLDLEYDDELVLTIVSSFEADPSKDLISIGSPLGESMVGKTIGEEIQVAAPAGISRYRIIGGGVTPLKWARFGGAYWDSHLRDVRARILPCPSRRFRSGW